MKKVVVSALIALFILLVAFRKKQSVAFVVPAGWSKPAYNFRKNPLSEKKIQLGRMLFYDPVLSKDSTISCASCHSPYSAFTHSDHNLSHGISGKIGTRNSPVLVNLAWGSNFMWDGAVANLDEQAEKPICNPLEMDETMPGVVSKLRASPKYVALFTNAFGDREIKEEQVLKTISQFILTLVSADAKYDRVKRGEQQFTEKEANGYVLFQKNCASCHAEPLFTSGKFENNGLVPDEELKDKGRMEVTHNRNDSLKFKVPTLRNIEFSLPYMHDGRFKSMTMVLNHYIKGIQQSPTLNPALAKGINMTANEKADLVSFLLTLSDNKFLADARYAFPADVLGK